MFLRVTVTECHFEDGLRSTDKSHGADEGNRSAQLRLESLEVSVHVEGSFVCQQGAQLCSVRGQAGDVSARHFRDGHHHPSPVTSKGPLSLS